VAIAEFSGIIVFKSYFRLAENTRLRKSQTAQGARTLCGIAPKIGEFNNLAQQMINFIFVELWKKSTSDYP